MAISAPFSIRECQTVVVGAEPTNQPAQAASTTVPVSTYFKVVYTVVLQ